MKKTLGVLLLAALLMSAFAGCSVETKASKNEEESKYSFYYLNDSETDLKVESYTPEEESTEVMVKDLLQRLGKYEAPDDGISLLPEGVTINSYEVQDDLLVIDFNSEYSNMSKAREVLTRAGIVKMLLLAPDISRISFTVDGSALLDTHNSEVGEMTEDTFVEYSGGDSDSYRYDTFTLYFTNETGDKLVKEVRNVYYRGSLPKERIVLEQLARGPLESGNYPTISEDSVALKVTTSDNICYLNLNSSFKDQSSDVSEKIALYSVVNSIIDSCGVEKIQISIEGSTDGNFRDELSLYNFYEKNDELIEQDSEEKS